MYRLSRELSFPHPRYADADGLLALGGDLSPQRLLLAYQYGIFPWYSPGEPILWWSPDPRWVLFPEQIRISKTMRQVAQRNLFEIRYDTAFEAVIAACSSMERPGQDGTWIVPDIQRAYTQLHEYGLAHSVEAWQGDQLVGGLYGVSLGKVFYGESMFAKVSNASKAAFIHLAQSLQKRNFYLIDCQVHTEHLESLGACSLPREDFLQYLEKNAVEETLKGKWTDWV